jgi:hypothetical protein
MDDRPTKTPPTPRLTTSRSAILSLAHAFLIYSRLPDIPTIFTIL